MLNSLKENMEQNDGMQGLPYCCHLDTEKFYRTFMYLSEYIVVGRSLEITVFASIHIEYF